jgi:putative inorganic carbon (hco3(-)) transporter
MLEIGVIVALQAALLAAVILLREPKLLIPCVVLGLPFEYLGTRYIDTLGEGGISGAIRALLNPGKAAMLATICLGIWRARRNPGLLFPNSAVLVPIVAIAAVAVLAVGWSDTQRPNNTILILPMYVAFVFVAPMFIEDRRDLERIVAAFFGAAIALSLIAVAQRYVGPLQWRDMLFSGGVYRSNATFADPNNLARILAISVALAAGMILTTGARRLTVYLAIPTIVLGLPAILVTASRSGWLGVVLGVFLMVWFAPIERWTKFKITASAAACLLLMVSVLYAQGGADADRIRSFTGGFNAILGQREFLIRAGWEIWKDNPVFGVGSGSYQTTLILGYLYLLPWWAEVTLSHTSLISILAEWGVVGMIAFGFVAARLAAIFFGTYRAHPVRDSRLLIGWCIVAVIGIFFQSQSEGRLFEEPYLWLILAMFVSLELGAGERLPVVAVLPAASAEPAQEPAGEPARTREPIPAYSRRDDESQSPRPA